MIIYEAWLFRKLSFPFLKVHVPPRLDRSIGDGICKDDQVGLKGYTPELMKETWQVTDTKTSQANT